jgi:hypothetical protein
MAVRKVNVLDVLENELFSDYAIAAVDRAVDLAMAVQAEWGDRCPDFDAECPVCRAWADCSAKARAFICN